MGLFTPAWMNDKLGLTESGRTRMFRAIDKIKTQEKLTSIVREATYYNAYEYAIKKITDTEFLKELALYEKPDIRILAVSRLNDAEALKKASESANGDIYIHRT